MHLPLTGLPSNLWKYFLVNFTSRRNFIPILSVYFLTLPDTHANQIGLYTGIGYLMSMLFQVPAGMIADKWGQKRALLISKVLLIISSIVLIFAGGFISFTFAAVCMSLGNDAFSSGIANVFLKKTLEKLDRGDDYRRVSSRMNGNIALTSLVFILILPLLTVIDIRAPIVVTLVLDIIGLIVVYSLFDVHTKGSIVKQKSLFTLIRESRGTGFLPYALFSGTIGGFLFADNAFRSPYLTSLGYPLVYIGLVMGGSRLVWWAVGRYITTIERYIPFQRLVLIELIIFPLYYIGASHITNPWIVGILFSLIVGWFWGRNEIYTDVLMQRIHDEKYRSTLLGLKSQVTNTVQVSIAFGITGIMGISYSLGFQVLGGIMFVLLSGIYFFGIRRIPLSDSREV